MNIELYYRGGGRIFIYSCSERGISFEINIISKEIRLEEHEYVNVAPPPVKALVSALTFQRKISRKICGLELSFSISRNLNRGLFIY